MGHIHEKIDLTVDVFVVFGDKVLLRKHDKYGIWLGVGGHVELDEDPNEAALREVKEEVGLSVRLYDTRDSKHSAPGFRTLIPPIAMNRHDINPTHEHVSMIYFAYADTDNVIPENETDEWKWGSGEEVDAIPDIRPDVAHHAKRAIRELSS